MSDFNLKLFTDPRLLMDFMVGTIEQSPLQIITKYPDSKIEVGSNLQILKQKALDIIDIQDACSIDELLNDEIFKKDIEEYILLREQFITEKLEERLKASQNILISVGIGAMDNEEIKKELGRTDVTFWL